MARRDPGETLVNGCLVWFVLLSGLVVTVLVGVGLSQRMESTVPPSVTEEQRADDEVPDPAEAILEAAREDVEGP